MSTIAKSILLIAVVAIIAASNVFGRDTAESKLLQLAKEHFKGLTTNDVNLFRAVANGGNAYYRVGSKTEDDPTNFVRQAERIIGADRIQWLCTDPAASAFVTYHGIQINGAWIEGALDLSSAKIAFPLSFRRCIFWYSFSLDYCHIPSLDLSGSLVEVLHAQGIKVEDNLLLCNGFKAAISVDLSEATIGGELYCAQGHFCISPFTNVDITTLNAFGAKIGGTLHFDDGFIAEGKVTLASATIGGDLDCYGGKFLNAKRTAINADGANIGGYALLNGTNFIAAGEVSFLNASIGLDFDCRGGHFINSGTNTYALYGLGMKAKRSILLNSGFIAEGKVTFASATIGGDLDCYRGQFLNTNQTAINADGADIAGYVLLNGTNFVAAGEVSFLNASIGLDFDCRGGHFFNSGPKSYALDGFGIKTKGSILLSSGFVAEGIVTLASATIGGDLDCFGGQFLNADGTAINADGANIAGYALLNGTNFMAVGEVRLLNASIGLDFECDRGHFTNSATNAYALNGNGIKTKGCIYLRDNFRANGAVSLAGASIGGDLNCNGGQFLCADGTALNAEGANIAGYAILSGTNFMATGEVRLQHTTIGFDLSCLGGQFINPKANAFALNAQSADIKGTVFLREPFNANGSVTFMGAKIGGDLDCENGSFSNPDGEALNAERAAIKGSVFLRTRTAQNGGIGHAFTSNGEVNFNNATVGGNLACNGGQFVNAGIGFVALRVETAEIEGDVLLNTQFNALGEVVLAGVTVGGDLRCSDGHFMNTNKDGVALDASGMKVAGVVYLGNGFKVVSGSLDLSETKIGTLSDADIWPAATNLILDGFVYERIGNLNITNVASRINWLRLQEQPKFYPQPYEQLAEVLRKLGYDDEAKTVLIDKNKDHARFTKTGSPAWWWYDVFGKFIRYGYRPWPALLASTLFLLVGWLLFSFSFGKQCRTFDALGSHLFSGFLTGVDYNADDSLFVPLGGENAKPKFNAFVYSLETFVPLLKLVMGDYWQIDADKGRYLPDNERRWITTGSLLRFYFWIHIIAGWILTTLLVGAFTGLIKT